MPALRARPVLVAAAVVLLAAAWYAFRPELLFIDRAVDEPFPATAVAPVDAAGPVRLAEGRFRRAVHPTRGTAAVHRLADGSRVLRLTEFETDNGPDLVVWLTRAGGDVGPATEPGSYVDLGGLKGNVGDQNYLLPDDMDLAETPVVLIWCRRFSVPFGSALLSLAEG